MLAITTYSGVDQYKTKPRLIRQADDVWGNNQTLAIYESDIAWFLMATTPTASPATRIWPSHHRPVGRTSNGLSD